VRDGERLELGNIAVDVLHVPGHTPEHIALAVTDRTRANEPWLVFTGHTLMVGDMGRTELATTAEDGARALFESAQRLRVLPDHVAVLPGAFSGSVCGRSLSGNPVSTIGFERRYNKAFGNMDRSAFIEHMLRDTPPRPANAAQIRAENLGL
jgi:glyoxylase-like metal-dependent hydrolase (beta-lactamase superfamily II)